MSEKTFAQARRIAKRAVTMKKVGDEWVVECGQRSAWFSYRCEAAECRDDWRLVFELGVLNEIKAAE